MLSLLTVAAAAAVVARYPPTVSRKIILTWSIRLLTARMKTQNESQTARQLIETRTVDKVIR